MARRTTAPPAPEQVSVTIRMTLGEAALWRRLSRAYGRTAPQAFGRILRIVDRGFQAVLRPHQRALYLADELTFDAAQDAMAAHGFKQAARGVQPYASIAAGKPNGAAPLPNGANGHATPAPRLRQGPVPPPGASFMREHGDQFVGSAKLAEYSMDERDTNDDAAAAEQSALMRAALDDSDAA